MTDRELKMYAISGIIVKIAAEKDKLEKATDEIHKQQIQNRIYIMSAHYTELLTELQNENPLL